MKNKILVISTVLVGLLCLIVSASSAQDVSKLKYPQLNELKIPEIEKVTLDNGIRLYILEDRSLPLFNVSVRLNCGSYLEPVEKIGLAEICGSVMRTGGTAKWTGDEIDELLEGIGGSVETGISTATGTASVNVLSEYTDLGLEVLAEILRRPVFDQDKIDMTKMQYRTGIARRNDVPAAIVSREYNKLIYGKDSPYARHAEYATIDAISRDDLVEYHRTFVAPENVQMAIWGDIDTDEIVAKIETHFGDWARGGIEVPPKPKVNYEYRSKVYYIEKPDVEQSYIRMGHIGGFLTDPDHAARLVMSNILGESFTSRITSNVRTRLGLAYSTRAYFETNVSYPATFFAFASTKPESTLPAAREMIAQIKSMATVPPTEDEMAQGKDGYLNSFVFNFDTRAEVIMRMMAYDFLGIPLDYQQQIKKGVEEVTPEAVVEAAGNNLNPDQMIVVVLGKAEDFGEPLENLGLGPVDTIDITIPSGEKKVEVVETEETLDKGTQLLQKLVAAYGGVEPYQSINNISLKGKITMSSQHGDIDLDFEAVDEYPDRRRNVILMMGQPFYDIRDGDGGWTTGPQGDVIPMTDEDIAKNDQELMRNLIYIFRVADNPPFNVNFGGTEIIDDVEVEFIALTDASGESLCRLGVAPDGKLVHKEYWGITGMGAGLIKEMYGDWTEFQGVLIPKTIHRTLNDADMGKTTVTEVLINSELAAETFAKPEE